MPKRQSLLTTSLLNHLVKIDIVFPVPGETEVIIHYFNYKGLQQKDGRLPTSIFLRTFSPKVWRDEMRTTSSPPGVKSRKVEAEIAMTRTRKLAFTNWARLDGQCLRMQALNLKIMTESAPFCFIPSGSKFGTSRLSFWAFGSVLGEGVRHQKVCRSPRSARSRRS